MLRIPGAEHGFYMYHYYLGHKISWFLMDCTECGMTQEQIKRYQTRCSKNADDLKRQQYQDYLKKIVRCIVCGVPGTSSVCPSCTQHLDTLKRQQQQQQQQQYQQYLYQQHPLYDGPQTTNHGATSMKCQIWWDDKVKSYYINTPYDPKFVELLKTAIPGRDRQWDPVRKFWSFDEKYFDAVEAVAKRIFGDANVAAQKHTATTAAAPVRLQTFEQIAANFVKTIYGFSPNALNKAYQLAAFEVHPDRNQGSGDKMAQLNAIWQALQEALKR